MCYYANTNFTSSPTFLFRFFSMLTTHILPFCIDNPATTPLLFPNAGVPEKDCPQPIPFFPGNSIYDQGVVSSYFGNHVPHWEIDQTAYHACFRLIDSIPVARLNYWLAERKTIMDACIANGRNLNAEEMKQLQFLYSEKVNEFLDSGYGSCLLKKDEAAKIVMDSLDFYNGKKYCLFAWCVMPNHVHVIFMPYDKYTHSEIIQGWKSFTAHAINKALGREGALWQVDTYNHIIRSQAEYYQQIRYVWNNPEKAGLLNWKWRWMCLDK